ncbi:hypothetical protein JHK87_033694 [Glycine soja]|nr:hypothetical protein JHK87_033694 [Glycine soja]
MHELGSRTSGINSHDGPTRNPYDTNKIAGGSSSGSASLVSVGLCPIALGVDWGVSHKLLPIIGATKAHDVSLLATPLTVEVAERYKAVINDGLKLDLGHTLSLEKTRENHNANDFLRSDFSNSNHAVQSLEHVTIVMEQMLRLLHTCALPLEDVDFINYDGKTMNKLLLEVSVFDLVVQGAKALAFENVPTRDNLCNQHYMVEATRLCWMRLPGFIVIDLENCAINITWMTLPGYVG